MGLRASSSIPVPTRSNFERSLLSSHTVTFNTRYRTVDIPLCASRTSLPRPASRHYLKVDIEDLDMLLVGAVVVRLPLVR